MKDFAMPKVNWEYVQATGEMRRDGVVVGVGYSGDPEHKNDVRYESFRSKGPIPRGAYRMIYVYPRHPKLGELAITLRPVGHDCLGRSNFMIHADSVKKPGTASEGCIVIDRKIRKAMAQCIGSLNGSDIVTVV